MFVSGTFKLSPNTVEKLSKNAVEEQSSNDYMISLSKRVRLGGYVKLSSKDVIEIKCYASGSDKIAQVFRMILSDLNVT